jgi:UDP-N-acetylmuramate--alanine ligase
MGCPAEVICNGFNAFDGVKRRFTKVGEVAIGDGKATIIDDYAHHPVEITAVLSAARESTSSSKGAGRVIAVAQPHRFTRLRDLLEGFQTSFNDADIVYVAPVYAAGEDPIEGADAEALVSGLKERGHRAAATISGPEDLASELAGILQPGDMVVCLGAGDITKWAAGLADAVQGVMKMRSEVAAK